MLQSIYKRPLAIAISLGIALLGLNLVRRHLRQSRSPPSIHARQRDAVRKVSRQRDRDEGERDVERSNSAPPRERIKVSSKEKLWKSSGKEKKTTQTKGEN